MNDTEFLSQYAQEGSQAAFAELVRRRIGLVYSAALRQTRGDAHRAQEVTQAVFTDLARKAALLCRHRALIGWLYTSTHYTAAKLARTEWRRLAREQEAYTMQQDLASPAPEIPAEGLRPLLDEAMHHLSQADRRALLLRFFDGCSMADLGRSLGLSESAAKKRVERALTKLRGVLARRGLSSTVAAVGAALGQEAAAATAPPGLASIVSGGALAAAATGVPGLGLLAFIMTQKLAAGLLGLVLAAAVGTVSFEVRLSRAAQRERDGARSLDGIGSGRPDTIEVIDPPRGATDKPDGADNRTGLAADPVRPLPNDLPPPAPRPAFAPPLPASQPAAISISQNPPALPPDPGNLGTGVEIFDPAQLDQQPAPVLQTPPTYPLAMQTRGVEGRVIVDFVIDASGLVRRAVALRSSRSEFESAAVEAVSLWKFRPGWKGGRAVSTHLQVPIVFTLHPHE